MTTSKNIYEQVTLQIIEKLKQGVLPWRKPWDGSDSVTPFLPHNFYTQHQYSGVNRFILLLTTLKENYTQSKWATFNQIRALGGNVRKGEHGTQIIFVQKKSFGKRNDDFDNSEDPKQRKSGTFVKRFTVFNLHQCESIEVSMNESSPQVFCIDHPMLEKYVVSTQTKTIHGGNSAAYYPDFDTICMPYVKDFTSQEAYFATYFHELIHWTAHPNRLNRDKANHSVAFEELIAEIGACFLTTRFGFKLELENHMSYIDNWLSVLKDDHKFIFKAASAAQKAVDYLDSLQSEVRDTASLLPGPLKTSSLHAPQLN